MGISALQSRDSAKEEAFLGPCRASENCLEQIEIALLTGGSDRHYAFGLATALTVSGVHLDVIGSDNVDSPEMHATPGLRFFNLIDGQQPGAGILKKVSRLLSFYRRLAAYAWTAQPKIFHILWNNKFEFIDRTLLMFYYKALGKKIVLTAHNVNQARRDNRDSFLNRMSLKVQYSMADHIFVHTEKMRDELVRDYGIAEQSMTIIPYGINNAVPQTSIMPDEAKRRLGIPESDKVVLFFGNMRPSKGLEYLLEALEEVNQRDGTYRLIIAGRRLNLFEQFWVDLQPKVNRLVDQGVVILRNEFIPDEDIELYFKAADVLALPYTEIFQSGVLFLSYSFGLPVIATDVGSLRQDIVEGQTGFLCKPRDPGDLARSIERYFDSSLFKNLDSGRQEIRDYANLSHSWKAVAETTHRVYSGLVTH